MTISTIPRKYIIVSDSEPVSPFDGMWWRDTSGNNKELNIYDSSSSSWELFQARGSDTPEYPVEGSIWRDTSAGSLKQYNGSSWAGIGVTDHSNLSGLSNDDHTQYLLSGSEGWELDQETTLSGDTTITLNNNYDFIKVIYKIDLGTSGNPRMTINGDTGANYNYYFLDNSTNTGFNFFNPSMSTGGECYGVMFLTGTWGTDINNFYLFNNQANSTNRDYMSHGNNTNVTSPLTQFRLYYTVNSGIVWVYGWNR